MEFSGDIRIKVGNRIRQLRKELLLSQESLAFKAGLDRTYIASVENGKIGLSTQIFAAMLLGAVLGIVIGEPMTKVGFIGTIWLNCIKMIVVPMVLVTIVTGVVSQKDMKTLGRISFRIMAYYIVTTLVACAIGILVTSIVKPGTIANFTGLASKEVTGSADITVADFFTGMFSSNIIQTFADGNILQTVVIAILLGVAILRMKNPEHKEKAIKGMNVLNDMVFSLINMIMLVSPIGVFFLMGDSFGKYGAGIFTSMATLVGTYYLACLVHVVLVYCTVIWVTAGINPLKFLKDSAELWVYTISTCSSVALYGCVILFISQTIGVPVTLGTMVKIILMSAILSTGGGGIPGSGIVKLLVMVTAFGLPTEIVGIIAAFYRLFDMGTTTNNCLGDLAGTVFVSKLEDKAAARAKSA